MADEDSDEEEDEEEENGEELREFPDLEADGEERERNEFECPSDYENDEGENKFESAVPYADMEIEDFEGGRRRPFINLNKKEESLERLGLVSALLIFFIPLSLFFF